MKREYRTCSSFSIPIADFKANHRPRLVIPTRISYFALLATTTCAALRKESRMQIIKATGLHRKSGGSGAAGSAMRLARTQKSRESSGGTCGFSPVFTHPLKPRLFQPLCGPILGCSWLAALAQEAGKNRHNIFVSE